MRREKQLTVALLLVEKHFRPVSVVLLQSTAVSVSLDCRALTLTNSSKSSQRQYGLRMALAQPYMCTLKTVYPCDSSGVDHFAIKTVEAQSQHSNNTVLYV